MPTIAFLLFLVPFTPKTLTYLQVCMMRFAHEYIGVVMHKMRYELDHLPQLDHMQNMA